ncbi:hypothetical protein OS493_038393 [Desmophyllum pertusum]|uniref:SWIM-type domain-containing protein n=1 Tax=Desmophyllum pertusum TaxID=174260 RepID=A0A9W9Z8D2_9CNID|nr:hypothetical protein OS493_038393 [Desmophyllum pertusum]
MASRALTEDDIPGASLAGRSPATFKKRRTSFLAKMPRRFFEGIENESTISEERQPNFPSDGWSTDLKRMPFFTRAEMNLHIAKSGKNIDSTSKSHSVPTGVRKATIFLNDEYLKDISTASDENFFYFKSHCYHSFRKNDAPHNLKVALCIVSGEVKHASCSCVAGTVGFCNHILALLMKICKFTLYECKNVNELDNEDDMQQKQACTSTLQQWHRKGRGDYKSTTSNGGVGD